MAVAKKSSCKAHPAGKNDKLVKVEPLLKLVNSWKDFIREPVTRLKWIIGMSAVKPFLIRVQFIFKNLAEER